MSVKMRRPSLSHVLFRNDADTHVHNSLATVCVARTGTGAADEEKKSKGKLEKKRMSN